MTVINRATAPVENTTLLSSQYFLCKGIQYAVCNIRTVCVSSTNIFVVQLQRKRAWNTITTHVQYFTGVSLRIMRVNLVLPEVVTYFFVGQF